MNEIFGQMTMTLTFGLDVPVRPNVRERVNPFSSTRRYKRHQNKVKVKGSVRNSSYLAGF